MQAGLRGVKLIVGILLLTTPVQVWAAGAKETVQTQVDQIVATIKSPGFKDQPKEAQIMKIREIINKVFDYEELSKRTLGKNWQEFSDAQQKQFSDLFSELLENTYADRVLAYTDEKIEFGAETELKKGRVEVASTIITKDNKSVPLDYRMIATDAGWKVYDVVIEGISLVQNYRSQFREILATKTPDDLINTLKEKVQQ
jgi:phospholipid transport system substrate-binding protein